MFRCNECSFADEDGQYTDLEHAQMYHDLYEVECNGAVTN